ncbi:MAG: hypothetical protein ACOCW6_10015 [Spirochaetota bacterium]
MRLTDYLEEYDISIDDVRWHLSLAEAERLLTYADEPVALARLIWSGTLESELHNMEEELLKRTQEDLDAGRIDEEKIHLLMEEIRASRISRRR